MRCGAFSASIQRRSKSDQMAKRDVEISAPAFDSLEESLEYTRRFQNPQGFIDEFVKLLKGRIKLSADPKYDSRIMASGSAIISRGQEAIKIGLAGLICDSELFKTLVHEEMHLRLIRKAERSNLRILNIVTNPDVSVEEDYVEQIAVRYLRMYEGAFGKFKH